mgnify:FL=1
MNSDKTPFKVYVRVRPFSSKEDTSKPILDSSSSTQIQIHDPLSVQIKSYSFNEIFPDSYCNSEIYEKTAKALVNKVCEGYNATCFAYGSTGAGKTHTMFGHVEPGLVYLVFKDMFEKVSKVKVSYLEIYNEVVKDLLGQSKNLLIVEDPIKGVNVLDLTEIQVDSLEQLTGLIQTGNNNRAMAPTSANEFSTRSHAVLQLTVESNSTSSKLSLIDLAGSERAASTENRGKRMQEGALINKSLLALANCINILSDPRKKGQYVPYRDSKLTRLLKESLGGNTATIMIACVSPAWSSYEETLNTLNYAQRAASITTKTTKAAKVVDVNNYMEIIQSLRNEIEHLRTQLAKDSLGETDISKELVKSQEEKKQLQKEVPAELDESTVCSLSQALIGNFEEHWELKQSIKEIETLNEQNKESLKAKLASIESACKSEDSQQAEEIKKQILSIQRNIKDNEAKRNEFLQNLYKNMKQKQKLQNELAGVKDTKKKEILELQISVRNLKIEKTDLHIQNLEYRQKAIQAQKQSDEKDQIISKMQEELNQVRSQLPKSCTEFPELEFKNSEELPEEETIPKVESSIEIKPMCTTPTKKRPKISPLEYHRNLRKSNNLSNQPAKKTLEFIKAYKNTEVTPAQRSSSSVRTEAKPPVLQVSNAKRGAFSNLHKPSSKTRVSRANSVDRVKKKPNENTAAKPKSRNSPILKTRDQNIPLFLFAQKGQSLSSKFLKSEAKEIINNVLNKKGPLFKFH